jgi:ribosomal protein S7
LNPNKKGLQKELSSLKSKISDDGSINFSEEDIQKLKELSIEKSRHQKKIINLRKKNLYYKFLGVLTKKGNKNAAKKILDNTFLKLSLTTNKMLQKLFLQVFIKLNSFVEVKSVRVRRASHMVPFSINLKRRSYLILKFSGLCDNCLLRIIVNQLQLYYAMFSY